MLKQQHNIPVVGYGVLAHVTLQLKPGLKCNALPCSWCLEGQACMGLWGTSGSSTQGTAHGSLLWQRASPRARARCTPAQWSLMAGCSSLGAAAQQARCTASRASCHPPLSSCLGTPAGCLRVLVYTYCTTPRITANACAYMYLTFETLPDVLEAPRLPHDIIYSEAGVHLGYQQVLASHSCHS